MNVKAKQIPFLVCDDNGHTRRLVADVLAGAGFDKIFFARDGDELLEMALEFQPRIVITSSRISGTSGLEFTRTIRAGYGTVSQALSIIVMTDSPTQKFIDAARASGVDELLARPFTGSALLSRVEAVLLRPRQFIESIGYVGPCRRRRMLEDYGGPMRRFTDPLEALDKPAWECESNRELVRSCLKKISELTSGLTPSDRRKLREVYSAVREAEELASEVRDQALGDAARSLLRYVGAMGATGMLDIEVLRTHIDAMQQLTLLGSDMMGEREGLVKGLVAIVDKRLGRAHVTPAALTAVAPVRAKAG